MSKKKQWERGSISPPRGWLWWTAVFVLVAGGIIAYIFQLNDTSLQSETNMRTTILVSVIIAGICVISALADRFIEH